MKEMALIFKMPTYITHPGTEVRNSTPAEIEKYLDARQ